MYFYQPGLCTTSTFAPFVIVSSPCIVVRRRACGHHIFNVRAAVKVFARSIAVSLCCSTVATSFAVFSLLQRPHGERGGGREAVAMSFSFWLVNHYKLGRWCLGLIAVLLRNSRVFVAVARFRNHSSMSITIEV